MTPRKPYEGTKRKLVIAFDIGTTFSGVSYTLMDPGQVPKVYGVTNFPGQAAVGGDCKIPSIIYYDRNGDVQAVGAEANKDNIKAKADDQQWIKLEWWKLHLRPRALLSSHIKDSDLPPLPGNKTILTVFADFIRYLFDCTRKFIQDAHGLPTNLWQPLEDDFDLVLTHPNGWEGKQQDDMRLAVVEAGVIQNIEGARTRVRFVTEGEASLHHCIRNGLATDALSSGKSIMIVDAGGGTIDFSCYNRQGSSWTETTSPECTLQGSIFVNVRARRYLEDILRGSKFDDLEEVNAMVEYFATKTKLGFGRGDDKSTVTIKFGGLRDNDTDFNTRHEGRYKIRHGTLTVPGADIAQLFEPALQSIIDSVDAAQRDTHTDISNILMVGGFSASDWLYEEIKSRLEMRTSNLIVSRPDGHINKAVADGAVAFYLDHSVSTRVAKTVFGMSIWAHFDPYNPEHTKRETEGKTDFNAANQKLVKGGFDVILKKGTQVSEKKEFSRPYERVSSTPFYKTEETIYCYRGSTVDPAWMDVEPPDTFSQVCTIRADVPSTANIRQEGGTYKISYEIILLFGLTEFQAQVCWGKDGKGDRSPAAIVYEKN